jgi:hypothetical protein
MGKGKLRSGGDGVRCKDYTGWGSVEQVIPPSVREGLVIDMYVDETCICKGEVKVMTHSASTVQTSP